MRYEAPRILVVDDDLDTLLMIRSALEAEGYLVQPALNSVDALVHIEHRLAGRLALVLTDVRMPLQNGWDFIRALRELDESDVPVVVMTGTEDRIPRELVHDVAAVLRKPFDVDVLLASVADALDSREHTIRRAA